jgi:hypothetical protein
MRGNDPPATIKIAAKEFCVLTAGSAETFSKPNAVVDRNGSAKKHVARGGSPERRASRSVVSGIRISG